jgi:IS605 OrfB family transposase
MVQINKENFVRTLRVRVKDKHAEMLCAQARDVNFVWNFVNELSEKHTRRTGKFFSAYDLDKYTAGASKEGLTLHSQTVQAVSQEFVTRRKQFKKIKLAWRKSAGSRRSLGWIPVKASALGYRDGQVRYQGQAISIWDSYGLSKYELGSGSFSEDSRGRWYLNTTIKVKRAPVPQVLPDSAAAPAHTDTACAGDTLGPPDVAQSVGIDLGLNTRAVASDGRRLEGREYRALEAKLGLAQRAGKKIEVKNIHALIKNRRRDAMHKFSTTMTRQYGAIFVGDVSSKNLIKTKMAKSVLDAGWASLKTMLEYKSACAGVWFEQINEAYTTQICSCCGIISLSSPKGRAGLGIREWSCANCGSLNDRDLNAARNILARGHARLAGGIPVL